MGGKRRFGDRHADNELPYRLTSESASGNFVRTRRREAGSVNDSRPANRWEDARAEVDRTSAIRVPSRHAELGLGCTLPAYLKAALATCVSTRQASTRGFMAILRARFPQARTA